MADLASCSVGIAVADRLVKDLSQLDASPSRLNLFLWAYLVIRQLRKDGKSQPC